jgi:hypothetical protein
MTALVAELLPVREVHVAHPSTKLDQLTPVYQFNEVHSMRIAAPKENVYRAIKSVTADEILFFRTLVWIRRFGRPGPESILNTPERIPILEIALRTTFLLLAEEPNHELVVGTVVMAPAGWRRVGVPTPERFQRLREPGFALATMNYSLQDAGPSACLLSTETRVYATDSAASRAFARYWRVIYPGSALIRRMWLRAISRRAEGRFQGG